MLLSDAVISGDYRQALVALKKRLAEEIDNSTSGRDIAALSRQLTAVLAELENIPDKEGTSDADRIRQARNAGAPSGTADAEI